MTPTTGTIMQVIKLEMLFRSIIAALGVNWMKKNCTPPFSAQLNFTRSRMSFSVFAFSNNANRCEVYQDSNRKWASGYEKENIAGFRKARFAHYYDV